METINSRGTNSSFVCVCVRVCVCVFRYLLGPVQSMSTGASLFWSKAAGAWSWPLSNDNDAMFVVGMTELQVSQLPAYCCIPLQPPLACHLSLAKVIPFNIRVNRLDGWLKKKYAGAGSVTARGGRSMRLLSVALSGVYINVEPRLKFRREDVAR
jgi:hypothetical protein